MHCHPRLPPENALLSAWRETLGKFGAAPAIWSERGELLRSFNDVEAEAVGLASRWADLPAGTVVGVQVGNHPSWPALLLSLFRAGRIPLPLGRHMAEVELNLALQASGAGALVTTEAGKLRVTPLDAPPPAWEDAPPEFLKLTSGTSSEPRVVRFQAHQLVADAVNICATMQFGPADLNYGVIPLSHSYGFSNLLTPLLCRGVPLVVAEDRLPRAILQGLADTGATVFPGMPVFFEKLAELETAPPLPRLRLCISAGAALPPAVGRAFTARFGLKVNTFYGSSECGGIGYDASEEAEYEEGYAGRPMQGVEIAAEPDGRIAIRSAAVGDGYHPYPEPEVLSGGRFIPGDLVDWRDGGMYLTGRVSDLINIAGRKLNPAEVELQLAGFPGVRQAVVFGVPSRLRGEEPVACVAGDQLDHAELLRFCQQRLSPWQMPRDFWIVPEIEANERGKISRRILAGLYLSRMAQAV